MKLIKKSFTILILFVMTFNFFIVPINVLAESINFSDSYRIIDESIGSIENTFSNYKSSDSYVNDSSYKYAVDNLYESYKEKIDNYTTSKNSLGSSIKLRDLLVASGNNDLLSTFDSKNIDNVDIVFSEINDITYVDEESLEEVLFISKGDLSQMIFNVYFGDYNTYFSELNNDFDGYFGNYQNFYNDVNEKYLVVKNDINNYISLINDFISNEEKIGNKVDKNISGKDVISLLNECSNDAYLVFQSVLNKGVYNNEFDNISSKALDLYNKFLDNNKYYTDELITNIENLILKYSNYNNDLELLFSNNSFDYSNIDYSLVKNLDSNKISEFIECFEDGLILDSEYKALIDEINNYLSKKGSESDQFTVLLSELNDYYNKLNEDSIDILYSNFVYNANLLDEDIIDLLLKYSNLSSNDLEYKYLMDAKYLFYEISLKDDSNYQAYVRDEYFVINGSNINSSSFKDNIDYKNNFNLVCSSDIINDKCKLELFDRNDELLRELSLVIKNDIDGNGVVDNNDIDVLKDEIFDNSFNDYETLVSDINKDKRVDINDLVLLDNLVNNKQNFTDVVTGSFDIKIVENDNQIIYKVYLKTDGLVRGVTFNINNSEGLKISSVLNEEGISYKSFENSLMFIGLGEYKNGSLLASVVYDKINSDIDHEIDLDGSMVFDNLNYIKNITSSSVIPYVSDTAKQTVNRVSDEGVEASDNSVTLKSDESVSDDSGQVKSAISGEDLEQDEIVWGNVIKVLLIVLVGALIIYLLNREDDDEEISLDEVEHKKE